MQVTRFWRVAEFQDRMSIHNHGLYWCDVPFRIEQLMDIISKAYNPDTKNVDMNILDNDES